MKYAIGVSNGTDAIWLTLMAPGIGAGDEVITYPNPFFATAETIWITGATAVLVDCDPKTNQEILCHCFYSGPCERLAENKIRIFAIAARFVTLAAIIKCLKNPKISPPAFPTVAFPARTVSLYLSRRSRESGFFTQRFTVLCARQHHPGASFQRLQGTHGVEIRSGRARHGAGVFSRDGKCPHPARPGCRHRPNPTEQPFPAPNPRTAASPVPAHIFQCRNAAGNRTNPAPAARAGISLACS